jgi:hypothetical protein
MKVTNIHQRLLNASPERVGALIDSLASPADPMWPSRPWPRMRLDRPLAVGATGGHGPIGYVVEAYTPGQSVRFRITAPKGFDGWHQFEVLDATSAHCVLEHRIEMRTRGFGTPLWALAIRWLHDAMVEDVLTQAEAALGLAAIQRPWKSYVRFLLWLGSKRGVRGSRAKPGMTTFSSN